MVPKDKKYSLKIFLNFSKQCRIDLEIKIFTRELNFANTVLRDLGREVSLFSLSWNYILIMFLVVFTFYVNLSF